MLLSEVVHTSRRVTSTRSRTAKTELVAAALRAADPREARLVASYLSGVLPQRRTGVGWRSLSDPPTPARASTLTLTEVDAAAGDLGAQTGPGSTSRRAACLTALMSRATADEQAFLRGLFTGELRQGALDGVLLSAIAQAARVPEKAVRRAVMLAGWPAHVAETALRDGEDGLAAIGLVVGRPLRPMLASSAPDVTTAVTKVGGGDPVAIERKIDGIRLQAHRDGPDVRLFTRSLDDITDRLPEVAALVHRMAARRLVLDAEVVALRDDGRPHPFQVTGARTASRTDPGVLAATTPVTTYVFDLLHLDGVDLLDRPGGERFDQLARISPPEALIERLVTSDTAAAAKFFAAQVGAGHEGVVVKSLSAPYAAGRRGAGWVKAKPRHTLDLVVLAAEWGSGRRRGLLSNIHLGARDSDGFVMLGKTFKGMTDEVLAWQTARFLDLETSRNDYVVHLRPEQVVEIAFDGLQRSSRYPSGLALRFARILRYRDDKTADEADTIDTVRSLASA